MNKEEMVKEAYTLMVKNNPDEAIKNLIRLDKELDKKNKIVFKAIEYLEDKNNEVIGILENNKGTFVKKQGLLDILRGKDNEEYKEIK